jgi:hypothetical protein
MAVLVGLSVLLLATAVGVAVVVTKRCNDIPCEGSPNDDEQFGRSGQRVSDRIHGLDGEDVIDASTFSRDRDVVEGRATMEADLTNTTKEVLRAFPTAACDRRERR